MDINVTKIFQQVRPGADIENSTNLIADYSLDSFDIMILMEEITKNYNIIIGCDDFKMENFLTKQTIQDMIDRNK